MAPAKYKLTRRVLHALDDACDRAKAELQLCLDDEDAVSARNNRRELDEICSAQAWVAQELVKRGSRARTAEERKP